jgi:hypothetical protein
MNKQLPDWFEGQVYNEGSTVTNPFSGEEYTLNNIELSMYDFIMGSQYIMELSSKFVNEQNIKDFKMGLEWFQNNNPKAYKILLD